MYVGYKQEKDNIGDLEDDLTQWMLWEEKEDYTYIVKLVYKCR